ncbi:hypothetical protein JCM21900_001004 [Sporobolomyces salmonicolor]
MASGLNLTDPAVSSAVASFLDLAPGATVTSLAASASAALVSAVAGNNDTASDAGLEDPLRAALPNFTYAMPVQLLILGVTLSLLGMLLIHLLFTIRYHLPLSKANYCLQTWATVLSLVNISLQLRFVMVTLYDTGRHWPYMFDYIEITLPDDDWTNAQQGGWLCLQGLNSFIVHSTHIQFLTMLFPSALEARLILGLLGPLALSTFALSFTTLSAHPAVNDLGDAIWNTANSSLTLLYTIALFIWGLTLNRSRAWRSEGGTATFGILALVLGMLGTGVNFVEIKEDRMRWLPGVVTCILLWQSWVGFWWWVGAGMWAGEAEDVQRRRDKKARKAEQKRRKKERAKEKEREKERERERELAELGAGAGSRSLTGSSLRRRFRRDDAPSAAAAHGDAIALRDLSPAATRRAPPRPPAPAAPVTRRRPTATESSSSISSSRPTSHHFYTPAFSLFVPFFTRLRTAHDAAAVAQAAKPPGLPEDVRRGWGIRALMMRGRKERGERRQAAEGIVRAGAELDANERRAGFELAGGQRLEEEQGQEQEQEQGEAQGEAQGEERADGRDEGWEDAGSAGDSSTGEGEGEHGAHPGGDSYPPRSPSPAVGNWEGRGMEGQSAWWWRGWIGRSRLRDVSTW